jgi:hypothetical protein
VGRGLKLTLLLWKREKRERERKREKEGKVYENLDLSVVLEDQPK